MIEWTKEVWDVYNEMTAVIATVGNPDRRASLMDCQSKLAKAMTEYMDFLASPKEEVSESYDEVEDTDTASLSPDFVKAYLEDPEDKVEEAGDSAFDEESE
jgi:hypothetical protein